MNMTNNRQLVLDRLAKGPAGTAEICDVLDRTQGEAYAILIRLVDHRRIHNTGTPNKAKWELVK